jgi:hypothetical protein
MIAASALWKSSMKMKLEREWRVREKEKTFASLLQVENVKF